MTKGFFKKLKSCYINVLSKQSKSSEIQKKFQKDFRKISERIQKHRRSLKPTRRIQSLLVFRGVAREGRVGRSPRVPL